MFKLFSGCFNIIFRKLMIFEEEQSNEDEGGELKREDYNIYSCFQQNQLKLQFEEGDKMKYQFSSKPQIQKKQKRPRKKKVNEQFFHRQIKEQREFQYPPNKQLNRQRCAFNNQRYEKRMTPVQQRAQKILLNYSDKIDQQSLIFYKKINYRGSSVTEIVRPQNDQPVYLSKRSFPLIIDTHNSIHQITSGKIVNLVDPTFSQSPWKVLNKDRNTCNCTKSHCQKSYCQCFLNKRVCGEACGCIECKNTEPHFKNAQDIDVFLMGCQCHKSQCITSYCRCKKLDINCGQHCRCLDDCKN